MPIPDRDRCLSLLDHHGVPDHIVQHSLRVAQVGGFLAECLARRGKNLDAALVEAAALLHDITKMPSMERGEDHARTAFDLLVNLGYPGVADIVRQHVHLDVSPRKRPSLAEVHLVYYADKRVRHTTIVTLSERFDDLIVRYGTTPERKIRVRGLLEESELLERLIFARLDLEPARLNELNSLEPVTTHPPPGVQRMPSAFCSR
jgi:putative nucleotidyltransferase with HDIG domain